MQKYLCPTSNFHLFNFLPSGTVLDCLKNGGHIIHQPKATTHVAISLSRSPIDIEPERTAIVVIIPIATDIRHITRIEIAITVKPCIMEIYAEYKPYIPTILFILLKTIVFSLKGFWTPDYDNR